MTDDEIERRLRRALLDDGAEFAHSIDQGAIRARLWDAASRRQQSRHGHWLVAVAAVVAIVAIGVMVVVGPPTDTVPGRPSPASSTRLAPSPASMDVDPGWRLALDYAGQVTTALPDPVGVHFILPADATRWALKVRCAGPSALVVSTTFVHTAPCSDGGAVSRAVYRVESTQASGQIHLGIRGVAPTSFELIAETTASALDDPITLDPTPGPTGFGPIGPVPAPFVIPPNWVISSDPVNGGSGGIHTSNSDAPIFHPGAVTMVLTCVGSGTLDVELVRVSDPTSDPTSIESIAPGAGQTVACDVADGQVTIQLSRPSDGTENRIEVESESASPNVDFAWALELGQARP